MSLFTSFGRRLRNSTRRVDGEGWRIGVTKQTLAARRANRRRANKIAKASRRRNRP